MNFISTFDELNKLYEEAPKVVTKKVDDLCTVMLDKRSVFTGTKQECNDFVKKHSNTEVAKYKKFEIVQGAEVPVIKEACSKKKLTEDQDYFISDEDGWKVPGSIVLASWLREWDFSYDADTDTYGTIWNRSGDPGYYARYDDIDYFESHSCVVTVAERGNTVEVELDSMFTYGPETISQTFKNDDATIIADIEKFIDENQEKLWTAHDDIEEACSKKKLTEAVDLSKYRVALADYNDDDGYDQEDQEYLLKPGQTKGDLVVDLSYNAGFMYVYVHDEREATPDEIKDLAYRTFDTVEGRDYRDYGDVDVEDWLEESCASADDTANESLKEDAAEDEIEIIDDEETVEEVPAEEPVVEEPKQTIIECSNCGALVIVDEVEVDEESDLVNMKDKCKFCEEKEGYKIVGSVVPYEVVEEEPIEEPVEEPAEEPVEELAEDEPIEEDLADWYRKTFDKPASVKTQQYWEDELNGEMGEISDKRRKHLEKKFEQQRDWEERHPDKEVK